jgi:hypothetical protein
LQSSAAAAAEASTSGRERVTAAHSGRIRAHEPRRPEPRQPRRDPHHRRPRGERLAAYTWLARALLVSIFVTRVFSFVESQFGAVIGLGIDALLLISVQLMAAQERRRLEPDSRPASIASAR